MFDEDRLSLQRPFPRNGRTNPVPRCLLTARLLSPTSQFRRLAVYTCSMFASCCDIRQTARPSDSSPTRSSNGSSSPKAIDSFVLFSTAFFMRVSAQSHSRLGSTWRWFCRRSATKNRLKPSACVFLAYYSVLLARTSATGFKKALP